MSVQSQIERIKENVANTYSALSEMGATIPDQQNSNNIAATVLTVPRGGSSSSTDWKDITNKPFITEGSDTLTWDGNTEGLANMGMFYKVSDVVPTKNDFSNGCIFATYRFAHSHTITAEDAQSAVTDDGFASFDEAMIIPYDNYILSDGTVAPEAGVYFLSDADGYTWTSITIPGYTGFATEKIDPKCLYPIKWKDITNKPFITEGSDTLTWDGNTEGLVNSDSIFYKVSDVVPTLDDLVNGCTATANGIQCTCSAIQDGDLIYVSAEDGSPVAILVPFDNAYAGSGSEETKVAEKGTYLFCYAVDPEFSVFVSSITIPGYTGFATEKIDPKCLYPIKWKDITNKPFITEGSDTLTWDGNTEGLVSNTDGGYVKVSNAITSMADFENGATISGVFDGEKQSFLIPYDVIFEDDGGIIVGGIFFINEDGKGKSIDGLVFPESGVYFPVDAGITSITIPGYTGFTTEKIAPSHLYQPDWNQTDETAADFIKNKPFGDKEVVLLEEQTFTPDAENGNSFPLKGTPSIGDTLIIEYDGVLYECEVQDFQGILAAGNMAGFGMADTGEPFVCVLTDGNYTVMAFDASTNHTIFVKGIQVQKIPAKYSDNTTKVCVAFSDPSAMPYIYLDATMTSAMTKADLKVAMQKGIIMATQPGLGLTAYVSAVVDEPAKDYAYIVLHFGNKEHIFYTAEYTPET